MEIIEENSVKELQFVKCGDALVTWDRSLFALNCVFCKAIFMELTEFIGHIKDSHQFDLDLQALDTRYVSESKDPMKQEYSGSDAGSTENMDTFDGECEWIHDVMNEEIPEYEEDQTLDNENQFHEIKQEECSTLNDFVTKYDYELEENSLIEEIQESAEESESGNNENIYKYQSEFIEEKENMSSVAIVITEKNNKDCENEKAEAEIKLQRNRTKKEKFIARVEEEVDKYPELWDSSHPYYADKSQKLKTCQHITKLMQMEYPRKKIQLRHIEIQLHRKQMKIKEQSSSYSNNNNNSDLYENSGKRIRDEDDCQEDSSSEDEDFEQSFFDSIKSQSIAAQPRIRRPTLQQFQPNKLSHVDLTLIRLYEKEKCLWNVEHPNFTDSKVRMTSYVRIMNGVNQTYFSKVRKKLKIKELRLRLSKLCDWYKDQLYLKYRCKMLEKPFQVATDNKMHFEQFNFLQEKFEPTIEKEGELKLRAEVEAQYLKDDDNFRPDDNDDDDDDDYGVASTNSDAEGAEGNAYECNSAIINKQERLETVRFIEVYRNFPILWNPHFPNSHSFKAQRKAVDDMAQMLTEKYLMPMDAAIVRQKIKNIRHQYKCHIKKMEKDSPSNLWFAPQMDEFLKEHIKTSLRRVNFCNEKGEVVKKIPNSIELPFRFDANMPLNIQLIEILRDSPEIWESDDMTFYVSTDLLQNQSFYNIIKIFNDEHNMQLDEYNMLMLLHDLCEWFKREKQRQYFCNNEMVAATGQMIEFIPSSVECWEKMQFLADYTFLPNDYVCKTCQKSTKSMTAFLIDYWKHLSQLPFKCFYCSKRFLDITNCRTHECRIHSKIYNYSCESCGRKFAHQTDALVHHRRYHTLERLYVCEICGKSFISAYELKRHRNFHLRDDSEFSCNFCDKLFVLRSQLTKHKQNDHALEYDTVCKSCERSFSTVARLKKHMTLLQCKVSNLRKNSGRRKKQKSSEELRSLRR